MQRTRLRAVAGILVGGLLAAAPAAAEEVTFRVQVPAETPPGEAVFIVGDLPELAQWNPGELEMTAVGPDLWEIVLDVPAGVGIEYKYARGDWSKVEKNADGSEMDNRTAVVAAGLVLEDRVVRWADVQPAARAIEIPRGADLAVTFRVEVPGNTPDGEKIYISGDLPELGIWDGGHVELKQVEPNIWEAEVVFSEAGPAEYKYTRGDWGTVEKTADGGERDNRKVGVEPGAATEDIVVAWADLPAEGGPAVAPISNTDLSSRMMVNGRYVSKYISQREPDDRYRLNRPSHDIRLDFLATAGPTISVWARATFFTGQYFHFSFDFDRAWAHVHPEEFDLKAFYNEEVVVFDDPFELVGHRDLPGTIQDDDIPFGRGTAGAQIQFDKLGTRLAGMVANVHDFDVRNHPDTYDEIGTDWMAARASRPVGGVELGFTGRRIRTANWANLSEREPSPPPSDIDLDEFGSDWFELNETEDVLTVDLLRKRPGGRLDVSLGAGYQRWNAAWVIGDAEERRYLGGHVKVDDEIGSSSGYLGLARADLHVADNLSVGVGFRREFMEAPDEGDVYLAWVLKHREDANQHIFPLALPGHEREIDRAEGMIRWGSPAFGASLTVSRLDDNRRKFLIFDDRHATLTRVLPELSFRLGDRFECGVRYLYERGTRFGMNDLMGVSYAEQEWEMGRRFRFASEKEKVDTRTLALNGRFKISRRWFWDLDYQGHNLWRDYGDDKSVEVNGFYDVFFMALGYEPRPGIQVQLAWGVDPVDDEDDRIVGREIWMREKLAEWQYGDLDSDGRKNYRDPVSWVDDRGLLTRTPTIGDLMDEMENLRQVMIKAKVKF